MEHPFDIKAKTLIINIVAIIPVLLYFHRYVWPSSWVGVYLAGACLAPWVMMPLQLIVAESLAERFRTLRYSLVMAGLASLLSVINALYGWQICISVWTS